MDLEIIGVRQAGDLHGNLLVLDDAGKNLKVTGQPIHLLHQQGRLMLPAEGKCLFKDRSCGSSTLSTLTSCQVLQKDLAADIVVILLLFAVRGTRAGETSTVCLRVLTDCCSLFLDTSKNIYFLFPPQKYSPNPLSYIMSPFSFLICLSGHR